MTDNHEERQRIRDSILSLAREGYACDGSIEIDDLAVISMSDDFGAYVQAWVWVDGDKVDIPKEKYYNANEDIWDWPNDCANPVTAGDLREALNKLVGTLINPDAIPEAKEALALLNRIENGELQ